MRREAGRRVLRKGRNVRIGQIKEISVEAVDAKLTDFQVTSNLPEGAHAYYQFYKCKLHADSTLDLVYRVRIHITPTLDGVDTTEEIKLSHGDSRWINFKGKPPYLFLDADKTYTVDAVYLDAKDPHTGEWVNLRTYSRADVFKVEKQVSCWEKTPHFASGCELLKHYANDQCIVDATNAWVDAAAGRITVAELDFVDMLDRQDLNTTCLGCCTPAPKGRICEEHDIPSSAKAGTSVNIGVCVENTGSVLGEYWVEVTITGPDYTKKLTSAKKSIDVGKKDKIYVRWDLPLNLKSGTYTIDAVLYA